MTRTSPEVWVMFNPAAAFRSLALSEGGGLWLAFRRPLLLAFFFGCVISLLASTQLLPGLVAGESLSWGIVPLLQVAALLTVSWRSRHPLGLPRIIDLFFTGMGPWLFWLTGFAALASLYPWVDVQNWPAPPQVWLRLSTMLPILIWSGWIDFHFFREVLGRSRSGSIGSLLLQRLIAWLGWFVLHYGYVAWPLLPGGAQ